MDRLIDFLHTFAQWLVFWVVVNPWEQAPVLRLGKLSRTIKKPGLYFIMPLGFDNVMNTTTVPYARELRPQSLTTADDVGVIVTPTVTLQVVDPEKYTLNSSDAEDEIADRTGAVVAEEVSDHQYHELQDVNETVAELLGERLEDLGVRVISVAFVDCVKSKTHRVVGGLSMLTS